MVDKQPFERDPDSYITQTLRVATVNRLSEIPIIGGLSVDKAINVLIDHYYESKNKIMIIAP